MTKPTNALEPQNPIAPELQTPSNELRELHARVREFCTARDWDQFHAPKELAIGLVTESAELLDLFRFKSDAQCAEILADVKRREAVEDELADVFFFVLRFADRNQIDLGRALAQKLSKNEQKYPVETSRGSNKKYNE